MTFAFQKAKKSQGYLRLAVFGTAGSGKTFTSLSIATGLGGQIALIDTERFTASKYAGRFEFDILDLPKADIASYAEAISAAAAAKYNVLIIDSLSHGWYELLQEVERLAKTKYAGNTWSAWSEGTPKQRQFVDALLRFPGHVIATMRTKTEWVIQINEKGRNYPVRVGLAPDQGKGIEYEFDMLMELSPEHDAHVIKDRTGKYQDQVIEKPGVNLGKELAAWMLDGAAAPMQPDKSDSAPKPTRPADPETVRGWLVQKAAKGSAAVAAQGMRGATVGALELLFASDNDDGKAAKRHMLTQYFFNKPKSEALTDGECRALTAWAQEAVGNGQYIINSFAVQEAAKIIESLDTAQGQQPLM